MTKSYHDKIDRELLSNVKVYSEKQKNDCIVYAQNYLNLKKLLDNKHIPYSEYPFIRAFGVRIDSEGILSLAKSKSTIYITREAKVFTLVDKSREIMNVDTFYDAKVFGEDVTIAIIDTGISPHLDFLLGDNRLIHFEDLINNHKTPYDDNGHGTFVAGVACGSGLVSHGKLKGMAPKSKIVSIKAIEGSGETGAYKILEAMQWISENYKKYNIRVVCMSFGSTPLGRNDPLIVGASALWDLGIVVVAAAGNSGPVLESIKAPGYNPRIITVGGFDDGRDNFDSSEYKIARFSSRGPAGNFFKPDIIAPAVNIQSTDVFNQSSSFYTTMSGTSVATPMIAGICALLLSALPQLNPDTLKMRLLSTCQPISHNRNEEGYGYPLIKMLFR